MRLCLLTMVSDVEMYKIMGGFVALLSVKLVKYVL